MQTAWRTKAVGAVNAPLTLTLALSAACGGGGDRPAAPGGFAVATAPTTVSIMAGNFSIVGILMRHAEQPKNPTTQFPISPKLPVDHRNYEKAKPAQACSCRATKATLLPKRKTH